ncbi:hypothetical protein J4476_00035 [Candidatus Woesearchaeota archaeon]|nr:hypothetical protein [Candidatus Woesearchaeota archaeon]HIH25632.1 hypothetical protein [Nanoarchaeota archaeon]
MLEEITGFVTQNVSKEFSWVWIVFAVIVILILIFTIRQILDIAIDLWKLPFAIAIDAFDLMASSNPYFDVVAAVGSILIFWLLAKRGHHMSKIFGVIAAAECIIGVWVFPQYAFITNLVPTATLLMFIAIWSD